MRDHGDRMSNWAGNLPVARLLAAVLMTGAIVGLAVLAADRAPLRPYPLPPAYLAEAWLLAVLAVAPVLAVGVTVLALAPRSIRRARVREGS